MTGIDRVSMNLGGLQKKSLLRSRKEIDLEQIKLNTLLLSYNKNMKLVGLPWWSSC